MTPEEISKLPYRPNVGVMLLNADGLIFAGQRIDNPQKAWQMPQGGIDEGETPRIAALRELEEETGVAQGKVTILAESDDWVRYDLPPHLLGKLWKGRYRGQEQKWFLMRLNGSDADVNIATDHPEFSQWRWMNADELLSNIVPFKREVYNKVIKAFESML